MTFEVPGIAFAIDIVPSGRLPADRHGGVLLDVLSAPPQIAAALGQKTGELLATPPVIERLDVLGAKLPVGE